MRTANATEAMIGLYRAIAKDDSEAFRFLCAWHEYCHEWDDLVDTFLPGPEAMLQVAAHAIDVYGLPFYQKHLADLKPVAKQVTNTYRLSVAWEKKADKWQRQCADVLRHCGNEMVYAVAELVGGWAWRVEATNLIANALLNDRNEPA
jgi:hypothetical protein